MEVNIPFSVHRTKAHTPQPNFVCSRAILRSDGPPSRITIFSNSGSHAYIFFLNNAKFIFRQTKHSLLFLKCSNLLCSSSHSFWHISKIVDTKCASFSYVFFRVILSFIKSDLFSKTFALNFNLHTGVVPHFPSFFNLFMINFVNTF